MPGVGMLLPMRNTASRPSVNSTRLRRSVMANRFLIGLSIASTTCYLLLATRNFLCSRYQHMRRAAGRLNLLGRLVAEFVRLHRQLLRHVAARQHLDRLPHAVNQPSLAQQFGRDNRAFVKTLGERIKVHDGVLDPEAVVETALRHAPVQRHLAALESALELEAGTRLGTLVATAGLHAVA